MQIPTNLYGLVYYWLIKLIIIDYMLWYVYNPYFLGRKFNVATREFHYTMLSLELTGFLGRGLSEISLRPCQSSEKCYDATNSAIYNRKYILSYVHRNFILVKYAFWMDSFTVMCFMQY